MSVRVRLPRVGSKKNPIWRVVVSDQRAPRDGRFIETIGHYNPQTEPSTIVLDEERFRHWVARGAQPTNTVKQLVKAHAKGIVGGTSTGSAGVAGGGGTAGGGGWGGRGPPGGRGAPRGAAGRASGRRPRRDRDASGRAPGAGRARRG